MLVILFGLAGAGKNYVGELIQKNFNCFFWDADEALTEEMKECIKEKRSFTQDMRDRYYTIVIDHIKILQQQHQNIVVAQAFYKNKNRMQVLSVYPQCQFIQIKCNLDILQKRLHTRNNSVDENYAQLISKNFEEPPAQYAVITNNGGNDALLIDQVKSIFTANNVNTNQDTISEKPVDIYRPIFATNEKDKTPEKDQHSPQQNVFALTNQ